MSYCELVRRSANGGQGRWAHGTVQFKTIPRVVLAQLSPPLGQGHDSKGRGLRWRHPESLSSPDSSPKVLARAAAGAGASRNKRPVLELAGPQPVGHAEPRVGQKAVEQAAIFLHQGAGQPREKPLGFSQSRFLRINGSKTFLTYPKGLS